MSRLFNLVILLAMAFTLAVPGPAMAEKKSKHVVKHKTLLEVGQPLRVDIRGDLESCKAGWDCSLLIREPKGGEPLYLLTIDGEGKWTAFLLEKDEEDDEDEDKDKDKDAEEEKIFMTGADGTQVQVEEIPENICDGISLVEPDDGWGTLGDEWRSLPELTEEQRLECVRVEQLATRTRLEKMDGEMIVENDLQFFLVPADILPADSFEVESNGYWGAAIDGELIGSASKTGVITIQR